MLWRLSCWAQSDQQKFERDFYAPAVIKTMSIDDQRFAGLSPTSRAELLSARKTLNGFFAAVEKPEGGSRAYLAPSLSAKYKEISDLIIPLLGQETSVMSVGISDFSIESSGIEFKFYIVLFAEGVYVARESSAKLTKIGGSWKLIRIAEFS